MPIMINEERLKDIVREVLKEFFASSPASSDPSEMLDVKQAALLLNLARATIYEKTAMKILPHYKKGKKIMFKKSELLAWIDSGKVEEAVDVRTRVNQYLQSHNCRR